MVTSFAIGIDIGGTNTDIGLVRADGTCIARKGLSTQEYLDIERYADDISHVVKELLTENNVTDIDGIGIGAPNGNYYTGAIEYAPNLPFSGRIPLKELIYKRLKTKVILTNDANAAAYGEKIYGGAKDLDDFILITLGTGVGSGIFVNGQMVYGHDGFAGELGHATLFPHGRRCSCGRNGCLEQYASSRGILQTYYEICNQQNTLPNKEISCKELKELADNGNTIAQQTWQQTGEYLGIALANAVTFSSPQALFLMGGPVKAGHWLLNPLQQAFEENLLAIYQGKVAIFQSQLSENNAAILGAASLIYET